MVGLEAWPNSELYLPQHRLLQMHLILKVHPGADAVPAEAARVFWTRFPSMRHSS